MAPLFCAAWGTAEAKETAFVPCVIGISRERSLFYRENKENILRELDLFSINKAALFPEIDDVAEYIKEKYTK